MRKFIFIETQAGPIFDLEVELCGVEESNPWIVAKLSNHGEEVTTTIDFGGIEEGFTDRLRRIANSIDKYVAEMTSSR